MLIRQAQLSDISAMHRIRLAVRENKLTSTAISEADYPAEIARDGRGWVTIESQQIVGFGVANLTHQKIWALFVHPDYEGKGYGRLLLNTMVSWLSQRGVESISLTTEPNTRADKFYRHHGWRAVGLTSSGDMEFTFNTKAQP